MTRHPYGGDITAVTHYGISGGTFLAPVVLGENITLHLPRDPTPAMSGLPPRSGTFSGRDKVLERLVAALAPRPEGAGAVVMAVAGLPGVGKTELVLQAADRVYREEGWFPGGVLFVDMQGYRSLESGDLPVHRVLRSFLAALGVSSDHLPDDVQDLARIYRSALTAYADRDRRVLVVVDNAAAAEQVLPLLPGDPRVPLLVTSRHTLSDLTNVTLHDLDPLDTDASVDLLRAQLRRMRGRGDRRVDAEPEAAARIAGLCGHLPLALDIVATVLADTPNRSLAAFEGELRDTADLLSELAREERGVRAAFDLSYALLPADQARAFRLLWLAVYDSISTEAAARSLDTTEAEARRLLRALARSSLLRNTGPDGDRWSMHDLLADYAEERRLAHSAPENDRQALARLVEHYLTITTQAYSQLLPTRDPALPGVVAPAPRSADDLREADCRFDGPEAALAWLDEERDNLVTTVHLGGYVKIAELSVSLAVMLSRYFDLRSDRASWLLVAESAVETADEADDHRLLAEALDAYGNALHAAGRSEEAVSVLFHAADYHHQLQNPAGESHALSMAAGALQELHRHEEAVETHAAARAAFRRSGATGDDPRILRRYGSTLRAMGRFDDALATHDTALAAQRAAGDREGEAVTLNNLANALADAGLHVEAEAAYGQAIALLRETGNGRGEANTLSGLGTLLQKQRRTQKALEAFEQAREAARASGDWQEESRALKGLGVILAHLGRTDEAFAAYRAARDVAHEGADPRREADALLPLSELLRTTGKPDEAVDRAQEALELFRWCGDRLREGDALTLLADALDDLGQAQRCIEARERAAAAYEEVGEPRLASTLALLGMRLAQERRWAEAVRPLERAVELYRTRGEAQEAPVMVLGMTLYRLRRHEEAADIFSGAVAAFGERAEAGDAEAAWDEGEALLWLGHTLEHLDRPHERVTAYARAVIRFRALGDRDRRKTALGGLWLARTATGTAGWRGWLGWLQLRLSPEAARKDPARAESLRYRTVVDRRTVVRALLMAAFLLTTYTLTEPNVPLAGRLAVVLLCLALLSACNSVGRRWAVRREHRLRDRDPEALDPSA
jgi:tetratricopeptide (TPR) repeat protein